MARGCNCAGASCGCSVIAGPGIKVEGIGTAASPFEISNEGIAVKDAITTQDTATVSMDVVGGGTSQDPLVLSAELKAIRFADLVDVEGVPDPGQVPVWMVINGVGGWRPAAPPTTPPGSVTAGDGLAGDGSGASPLRARTSGIFGQGLLAGYGTDPALGDPVYTDAAGALRTVPSGARRATAATRPTSRGGMLVYETDTQSLLLGHDSGYEKISGVMPPAAMIEYAGATTPAGWLRCDGAVYLRADYPTLAAALGARGTVAGDALRFRVPDMRGRAGVGWDPDQSEFNTVGKQGGAKTHTLSINEMPSHAHKTPTSANATSGRFEVAVPGAEAFDYIGGIDVSRTGGGLPHNNMPPFETVNYLIRAM